MPFSLDFLKSVDSFQECQWIDSHCHFDFKHFDHDRERHWQYLHRLGCRGLMIPGVQASTWSHLIALCDEEYGHNECGDSHLVVKPWFYALGLHPYFLAEHKNTDLDKLKTMCRHGLKHQSNLVAIGEIGLDFVLPVATHSRQLHYFTEQLRLANELELPVILHARKSYDEIRALIRKVGFKQGGIVHAFTGSLQQGEALIGLGFKLGIGGALSHPRAQKLRKTVAKLPLESLVLETDAPDMKPAFLKGDRNSPVTILLLAQIVASLHKITLADVLFFSNNNLLATLPRMGY